MERDSLDLELNHREIEEICRQYFQDRDFLKSYTLLSGGAVNTTFQIDWGGEPFVLRFYLRDKQLVLIEGEVYRLIQKSVPVPEMLFVSTKPYPFAIFRFCPQPHIYEISHEYSQMLSYDLGAKLAMIHSYRFSQAGLFGENLSIDTIFEEGSSPYLEYGLELLNPHSLAWSRLGDTFSKRVLSFMEEQRAFFPVVQGGGCLVHSDFKPVNLLWNESEGLKILDWEFAHSGDGIVDFGILLRHFRDFPLDISFLKKGYRKHGGYLASDWIQRARITDFVNIIELLNRSSERPKLFQSLIESLNFTLINWKHLKESLWNQ